jgi:hypothetical protein
MERYATFIIYIYNKRTVPSGTASGGGSDSNTGVTQMGICVVGAESPCNGVK